MFRLSALRLRTQLILFFLLLIGILLMSSGIYIEWQVRRIVEAEIAERLVTVARLAAAAAAGSQILHLLPGDDESRTARRLARDLEPFVRQAGISRLLIFDKRHRALYDSRQALKIGAEYVRARFDAAEIEAVLAGRQAKAAKLFFNASGNPFMAAYAPLPEDGRQGAVICVEGAAGGLAAVLAVRSILITLGLLALGVALLSAVFLARQITRPLEKLTQAAEAIGKGQHGPRLEIRGSREVAQLSATIQSMRQAIVQRHQRQQMMLAGIAHEIRNPLGGIELFSGLIQKTCPPEQKPHVDRILSEVQHLKQVVTDFLEYAKPSEPDRQPVSVQKCLVDVQALLGDCSGHVDWELRIAPGLSALVDPDHLRRIFLNVLRNACEALPEKDGRIVVAAEVRKREVEIRIQDNGPGIPDTLREKVFEPFFTTRHQGTGLGLAIVRLLLEENGGSISFAAADSGGGTLCTLRLPAVMSPAP